MDPLEDPKLLPSQIYTTAAALLGSIDRKVVVSLRDGRKLFGVLRSFDQYANLVLQDTIERIFIDRTYGENKRGLYIVRGENVALLGEIDPEKEEMLQGDETPGSLGSLKKIPFEEIEKQLEDKISSLKKADKTRSVRLHGFGLNAETLLDNLY